MSEASPFVPEVAGAGLGDVRAPAASEVQLMLFALEMGRRYQIARSEEVAAKRLLEDLRSDYVSVIEVLARVVEQKDPNTSRHLERCREQGLKLAGRVHKSSASYGAACGFLLHDIGKIGIPESILCKAGPLDDAEWKLMRAHPVLGAQIVEPLERIMGPTPLQVIRHHHERYDGTGYPDRLRGRAIPLAARIFSVVDAFDAMTTDRPYRPALSPAQAMSELERGAGSQFDPEIVRQFAGLQAAA